MSSHDAFRSAMEKLRQRAAAAQNKPAATPAPARSQTPAYASEAGQPAYLAGLNPQQRQAVTHEGGHLLVVAGAGSGKTRVLTTRITHLINSGRVSPFEILAITFTNKAAKEMRERLEGMLGPVAHRMWISTFHSACLRILRAEHDALQMRSTFTIYDTADSQRLMTIVCREENIDSKQFPAKQLLRKVSDLKNELIGYREFAGQASDQDDRILATAYAGYQQRLQTANAVDFDDIIMLTVKLFREHPHIAEHYRRRFRHILVDEYQDTNVAQYELITELVGNENAAPHGELTVVGDADQSIYAFRGATIRNIENFERDFPNATTILLEQNYRSTQNILTAANALIANNEGRRVKNLWTDSGAGEKLVGYVADAESDEASFVVEEIDQLTSDGYRYGDVAVFYRTNAQSRALEEMFVRSGIPYKVVGGTKFYERKEIKDALAYLFAVANPDDTVSIRRILNEPRRGLGTKSEELIALHAQRYGISFGQALNDVVTVGERGEVMGLTPRAINSITEFVTMLREVREAALAGAAPADLLDDLMDRSGYLDVLHKSNDPQDDVRVENLAELHSVASDFSVINPEGTLEEFLDQIALVADSDQIPDEERESEGEVVLMTIHTAKGLEFPIVFVTGMEDGTFPHIRAMGSATELAEERRLAYVALTRARERLYVCRAASRAQWGAPQQMPPSRFIEEIPAEVIEWRREESSLDSLRDAAWSRGSRWGSSRSWDADEDFAPPTGAGRFVPERLGEPKRMAKPSAEASSSGAEPVQAQPQGRPSTGGLSIGDKVRHKSFGIGKVIDFDGAGKNTVAKVKFNSGAEKRLLLRFAPLEKV